MFGNHGDTPALEAVPCSRTSLQDNSGCAMETDLNAAIGLLDQ